VLSLSASRTQGYLLAASGCPGEHCSHKEDTVGLLVAVGTLVLTGVISPSGPVDRTALRWHVMVWDLWFLVWGLLLGVAAWHYGRASREPDGSREGRQR
jgi:hypothetical protein